MTNPLEEIVELIRQESGIQLHPHRYRSLRAAVARAEPKADAATFLELLRQPGKGPAAMARLLDEVTVHESSFFREWKGLEPLSWRLMLAQAQARGSSVVRVWSAACSAGEEPYSLAISAWEEFGPAEPPVRILGTDIAQGALDRARVGRYRERPLLAVSPELRSRYFTPDGREQLIDERARQIVEFRSHNLAHDSIPPLGEAPFDLVLCRNVLIYFDAQTVERVLPALERAMHPEGTLILGTADTLCGTNQRLTRSAERSEAPAPAAVARRRPLRKPERAVSLEEALQAAGAGRYDEALTAADALLARNPLDADASFVRGLVLLECGAFAGAAEALRRALYLDPGFGIAAFQLGRAYDGLGDEAAARRVYAQALRVLVSDTRHELFLGQTGVDDVAAACNARLEALTGKCDDVNEIVVADDSETILGLIVITLKRDGFDPATAVDGVGALAQIREHRPKLLIIDAMMPNVDGYEVCRILSEDPEIEKPYVIMLSAGAEDSNKQRAMEVGVDEYITKPFSAVELRQRVREILRP